MINNNFFKYLIIGIINTFAGYGIIFLLMFFGVMAELSNFFGYFIGFFLSYYLNKKYNFKSSNSHKKELPKFLLSMGIAYILNLVTLIMLYRYLEINPYLSQIIAGGVYTISGYLFSKIWVFN